MFREHRVEICVVLLDLTMPHMGGKEAYREMQRIQEDVCVIMSSGYDEQETITGFAGNGPAAFLQKPYKRTELLAKLHQVTGGNRGE